MRPSSPSDDIFRVAVPWGGCGASAQMVGRGRPLDLKSPWRRWSCANGSACARRSSSPVGTKSLRPERVGRDWSYKIFSQTSVVMPCPPRYGGMDTIIEFILDVIQIGQGTPN